MKLSTYLILAWFISVSCICAPPALFEEAQKKELENSDHVFIANVYVISPDRKTITVEIKEVFKGDFKVGDKFDFPNNYTCEPFIEIKGDWILYGKIENGIFRVNICGVSRSLNFPEQSRYFFQIPSPPPPNEVRSSIEEDKLNEQLLIESKENAIIETEKELKRLRNQNN